MITNPFTELKYSDKESQKRIQEIKEIDRKIKFLNSIQFKIKNKTI